MRGDGGFGGLRADARAACPATQAGRDFRAETLPQQALIYRLSGDYNPLHVPNRKSPRRRLRQPILHGLCSLGVAGHAILRTVCDYDPKRMKSRWKLRFSSPVYPGETIRTRKCGSTARDVSFHCARRRTRHRGAQQRTGAVA